MHETGLVRDLVSQLQRAAVEAGAVRVSGVVVQIGALSQFSAEHFREHFQDEVRGTPLEGMILHMKTSEDVLDPHAQNVMIHSIDLEVPERSA